ncbi:MAG: extensin family protein [Pseudomonadota bacterium]
MTRGAGCRAFSRALSPAVIGAAVFGLAACGAPAPDAGNGYSGSAVVDTASLPFGSAPGTRYAPAASPTPSPRGVAPAPSQRVRLHRADEGPPTGEAASDDAVERAIDITAGGDIGADGQICGDPRIIGRRISRITGSLSGCGIANPVRVTSVAGVALSSSVRVNCETAQRLADWVTRGVQPAAARSFGQRVTSMRPVASYACRTRNSRSGARLSEHAKGNAVDIAGFTLADGTTLSVLKDWPASGVRRRFMQASWKSACGPFGTVLGPQSDVFHRDHFHLDIAKHQGGAYCR